MKAITGPGYLTAVALAMLGWMIALFQGLQWALGL